MRMNEVLFGERQPIFQTVNQFAEKFYKRKEEDIIERTRRYRSALKLSGQMEALGSTAKAIDYLDLASKEGILLGDLYIRKAKLFGSMGDDCKCIECLELSLRADVKNHALAEELGLYFKTEEAYEKAIEYLKLSLVGEGAVDAVIYERISECYALLGKENDARLYKQRAVKAAL